MPASALKRSEADSLLIEDIARFFNDPLGFVLYAYPWGEPGLLDDEPGPDEWQREWLERLGQELRKAAGPQAQQAAISGAIRIAVASGHGLGKTR